MSKLLSVLIYFFSSPRKCSTPCDAGIMTRQVVCQQTAEDGVTSTVSDLACAYLRNKPATEILCNVNIPCRGDVNIQGMNIKYCIKPIWSDIGFERAFLCYFIQSGFETVTSRKSTDTLKF